MKLSLSNLAWDEERNDELYWFMQNLGIEGLEIAPTKLFGKNPYEKTAEAAKYFRELGEDFSLSVSSMQSIWYGREERLFGNGEDCAFLLYYTKQAFRFAEAIGCKNLVFGCPKNRVIGDRDRWRDAIDFFRSAGAAAADCHTVLALEANPSIYGTDFLNTTRETLNFCKEVKSEGVLVNLDFGTILVNGESLRLSKEDAALIHHVHISEPHLKPIQEREMHGELCEVLKHVEYGGYISAEMGKSEEETDVLDAAVYLREVFG